MMKLYQVFEYDRVKKTLTMSLATTDKSYAYGFFAAVEVEENVRRSLHEFPLNDGKGLTRPMPCTDFYFDE